VIVAENLALSFADAAGRRFIALDIPRFAPVAGKFTAVSGPSGSGKSTLLYVLAGLLRPEGGRVTFDGADIYALSETRRDAWRRKRVGFVFQDFHLIPELSPLANAALAATFGSAPGVRDRCAALLKAFGVPTERTSVDRLSRGERQRVALVRALAFDPPVILADEPTASLDAAAADDLIAALQRLAGEGRTVVVASHDRAVLERADMRIAIDHGRIAGQARVAA
jgi:putative ABC transport system ATP-binding protein